MIVEITGDGMAVGAAAQLLLGRAGTRIDWTMAHVSGPAGSFLGGIRQARPRRSN